LTTYRKSYIGFSKNPTVSVFLSIVMFGRLCRAETCAHSAIQQSTLAKGFLQGGPKTLKKFRIFEHFEILRHYIWATVTTRGKWSKSGKNPNTSPIHLSHLYRRISHSVLQAGSKNWHNINFAHYGYSTWANYRFCLFWASSSAVDYVVHRHAHITAQSLPGWPSSFHTEDKKNSRHLHLFRSCLVPRRGGLPVQRRSPT